MVVNSLYNCMLFSQELVHRAITDPIFRTMTVLGRKVASSIKAKFLNQCDDCGDYAYTHPGCNLCMKCIAGE